MAFDYSKLRGRIVEKYGTAGAFSKAMGTNAVTVSLLLNNNQEWRPAKILKACELLDISSSQIGEYFFTTKDKKSYFTDEGARS